MKEFQVGIFHLEDNGVIINHTRALIKHALDAEKITFRYQAGHFVLEVSPHLKGLREQCDLVILISDRNLGAEINGDVAVKAIAKHFQEIPIIIYSAWDRDWETSRTKCPA